MKAKDIAIMGISVSLLFICGYVAYFISKPLALPGAKFLLMAPMLSFFQYFPLALRPKFSTLLLLNVVFGLILLTMSPYMAIAIILSGLGSSVCFTCAKALSRPKGQQLQLLLGVASYPFFAVIISVWVSAYITGLNFYGEFLWTALLGIAVACFSLGLIGANFAKRLSKRILTQVNHFSTERENHDV